MDFTWILFLSQNPNNISMFFGAIVLSKRRTFPFSDSRQLFSFAFQKIALKSYFLNSSFWQWEATIPGTILTLQFPSSTVLNRAKLHLSR